MSDSDNSLLDSYVSLRQSTNPPPIQPEVSVYDNILQEIRDMKVLSSYQMYHLRGVSKRKLLRMIELYNVVMRNVNEII